MARGVWGSDDLFDHRLDRSTIGLRIDASLLVVVELDVVDDVEFVWFEIELVGADGNVVALSFSGVLSFTDVINLSATAGWLTAIL
jgi:hypothetical protein